MTEKAIERIVMISILCAKGPLLSRDPFLMPFHMLAYDISHP